MFKTTNLTISLIILQLLKKTADKNKIDDDNDETKNLSKSSIFKKLIGAGYLTSGARKACNHLRHAFI